MAVIPEKLKQGDEVRVVSPATSLAFIPEDQRQTAEERLTGLGLEVTYSRNGEILDRFDSAPAEARVADLHEAFREPSVKGMLTTLGGYNSNQLLRHLDYDLIRENPKVLCGFSDITALATAIHARTGLVTYSGPHFSTFGMRRGIEYTLEHFERCLTRGEPYEVEAADHWSDDAWYADQEDRDFVPNPGYRIIHEGEAEGKLLGGHLGTLLLLCGTSYMPELGGSILLLECDEETQPYHFDRELQSLAHQPGFEDVKGIILGRFQRASGMDADTLAAIVRCKPELAGIPIVADASFGHTTPQFTFPIGGSGRLETTDGTVRFVIEEH
ncbi:MAG: S66 family peptidase [Rubrobacteraceae bacterium]|nr:LD-carboxypeptidase [Rubrobacter sp.]